MLLVLSLLLILFVGAALYVGGALGVLGGIASYLYSPFPLTRALGELVWSSSTDFILVAIPMFILMGELLLRSGVAGTMYESFERLLSGIPGGLMHTNIALCTLFAATSGSSIATAATVGTVAIPNIEKFGYKPAPFLGSLAAGGTLGILIPPSINLIIYGSLAETSVARLYLAALIPGLLLAFSFSCYIFLRATLSRVHEPANTKLSLSERFAGLPALLPPCGLFLLVVGSIYVGLATPTEAAALGVMGTLLYLAAKRRLTLAILNASVANMVKTTAMVMLIVFGALFLNYVFSSIGLTDGIVGGIGHLRWPAWLLMIAIIGVYLVLGCFVETLTLMVATTPIIVPIVTSVGYSSIWFGVVFVILIELALITPPIGMNLFVIQSLRGERAFKDVALGALPYGLLMLLMIALLMVWPALALWLPSFYH